MRPILEIDLNKSEWIRLYLIPYGYVTLQHRLGMLINIIQQHDKSYLDQRLLVTRMKFQARRNF